MIAKSKNCILKNEVIQNYCKFSIANKTNEQRWIIVRDRTNEQRGSGIKSISWRKTNEQRGSGIKSISWRKRVVARRSTARLRSGSHPRIRDTHCEARGHENHRWRYPPPLDVIELIREQSWRFFLRWFLRDDGEFAAGQPRVIQAGIHRLSDRKNRWLRELHVCGLNKLQRAFKQVKQ